MAAKKIDAAGFGTASRGGFASAADLAGRAANADKRLTSIDIYAITEHPHNREVSQKVVDVLADSIRESGLGQCPLVRKVDDGVYEHISGWHRILAYRKLFEETGDEKYARIDCTVEKDCSDERAERLMWDTNLCSKVLTPEERARAWEFHAETTVKRLREENPEKYAGVPTNVILAEYSAEIGAPYSAATIGRDKTRAKRAEEEKHERERFEEEYRAQLEEEREEGQPGKEKGGQTQPRGEKGSEGQEEPWEETGSGSGSGSGSGWPAEDQEIVGAEFFVAGYEGIEPSVPDVDAEVAEAAAEHMRQLEAKKEIDKVVKQLSKITEKIMRYSGDIDSYQSRMILNEVKNIRAELRARGSAGSAE